MKTLLCLLCLLLSFSVPCAAEEITFPSLSGFAEIGNAEPLFALSQQEAVQRGTLLKMYLPQFQAHQYKHGNSNLVTRQVLICAPLSSGAPIPPQKTELLARSLEGIFIGFATVPRGRMDTPAQEIEHRQTALKKSLENGTPLLYSSQRSKTGWIYSYLIHYNMEGRVGKNFLTTAMASAVLNVKEQALFITASSILEGNDAETELDWVRETASSFAAAILKANDAKGK